MVLELLASLRRLLRAAERMEARVQFALHRRRRGAPLSEQQIGQFHRDGYLLVPGLVPETLVDGAEAAMWQVLKADARDPGTWTRLGPGPHTIRDERFIATYTDAMLAAAAQLAGEDVASFLRPRRAITINRVPESGAWKLHVPHLDRTIPESRHRTFPRPYRIGAMTYLTDVQPHGGGTVVWPGSHLELEAVARTDPRKYKYLAALTAELGRVRLAPPVELTPSKGDVFFHHYLCAHASSDNLSGTPRLAINHKW